MRNVDTIFSYSIMYKNRLAEVEKVEKHWERMSRENGEFSLNEIYFKPEIYFSTQYKARKSWGINENVILKTSKMTEAKGSSTNYTDQQEAQLKSAPFSVEQLCDILWEFLQRKRNKIKK